MPIHKTRAATLIIALITAALIIASASAIAVANAPPEPDLNIEWPTEAVLGESFEVKLRLLNRGSSADGRGGISASFPSLDSADVEVVSYTTGLRDVRIYEPGDDIFYGESGVEFEAEDLLIESDNGSWSSGASRTMVLRVTPKETGNLIMRLRSWICKSGYSDCSRDPSRGWRRDQQGFAVRELKVDVSAPEPPRLTSCAASPASVAAGGTVRLTAKAEVSEHDSRRRLHAEFWLDGENHETRSGQVDPGDRENFERSVAAPDESGDYSIRCSLYSDGDKVDTESAKLTVVQAHQPPTITASSPVGRQVNALPGAPVRFEAAAFDPDYDLESARWVERHTMMCLAPKRFSASRSTQSDSWETSFPLEGTFDVSVVFADSRGAEAQRTWTVTVVDGRDDLLLSAVTQLNAVKQSYPAGYSDKSIAEESQCAAPLASMSSELEDTVAKYHAGFAKADPDEVSAIGEFLKSEGLLEAGDDVGQAVSDFGLGGACGQICADQGIERTNTVAYTAGWLGLSTAPVVDIAPNARDAAWEGFKCIRAGVDALAGGDGDGCDAFGFALATVAIAPLFGKPADGARIVRVIFTRLKKLVGKVAPFALRMMDKVRILHDTALEIRWKLLKWDFDALFDAAYSRLNLDDVREVPGFDRLKSLLTPDTLKGGTKSKFIGANRVFRVLEIHQCAQVLGLDKQIYHSRDQPDGGAKKGDPRTDIDIICKTAAGIHWVESHSAVSNPVDKAKRLIEGAKDAKDAGDSISPSKVVLEFFLDDDNAADMEQIVREIRRVIDDVGSDIEVDVTFRNPAAEKIASYPNLRKTITQSETAPPVGSPIPTVTPSPTATATPQPASGRITVKVCNESGEAVSRLEYTVELWEAARSWTRFAGGVQDGDCEIVFREYIELGEYRVEVRGRNIHLRDWANLRRDGERALVLFTIKEDSAAPETRTPAPTTDTPTPTPTPTTTPTDTPTPTAFAPYIVGGPFILSQPDIDADGDGVNDTYGPTGVIEVEYHLSELVCGINSAVTFMFQTGDGPSELRRSEYGGCGGAYDSPRISFKHRVAAGDVDSDGFGIVANSLYLDPHGGGGGGDGVTIDNPYFSAGPLHAVDGNRSDVTAPRMRNMLPTSTPRDGSVFRKGEFVEIRVNFTEDVIVNAASGNPALELGFGNAEYTNLGNPEPSRYLIFSYEVRAGDKANEVDVTANSLVVPSGSSITDVAGNRLNVDDLGGWGWTYHVGVDGGDSPDPAP